MKILKSIIIIILLLIIVLYSIGVIGTFIGAIEEMVTNCKYHECVTEEISAISINLMYFLSIPALIVFWFFVYKAFKDNK